MMCVLKYFNDINVRFKSNHLRCSVTKGFPRNFAQFTGKHLYQSSFFNKVARLRSSILLKKRLWHSCFSVNFGKFLGTPFLQQTFRRLLLKVRTFMNQFCLTTFSFNYFKSLAGSFFLAFPSKLSVTFDVQTDLKMKHP